MKVGNNMKRSKLFWFLFGVVSVKWVAPVIESFMRLIVASNGLCLQDIAREEIKSQAILDAEYGVKYYKELGEEYVPYEDEDDE